MKIRWELITKAIGLFIYLFWRVLIAPVVCLFVIARNKLANRKWAFLPSVGLFVWTKPEFMLQRVTVIFSNNSICLFDEQNNSLNKILYCAGKVERFRVLVIRIEAYANSIGIRVAFNLILMVNSPTWLGFAAINAMPDNQIMVDV